MLMVRLQTGWCILSAHHINILYRSAILMKTSIKLSESLGRHCSEQVLNQAAVITSISHCLSQLPIACNTGTVSTLDEYMRIIREAWVNESKRNKVT